MSIKDGLYLFPESTGLSVYGVHFGCFSELGRGSAAVLPKNASRSLKHTD